MRCRRVGGYLASETCGDVAGVHGAVAADLGGRGSASLGPRWDGARGARHGDLCLHDSARGARSGRGRPARRNPDPEGGWRPEARDRPRSDAAARSRCVGRAYGTRRSGLATPVDVSERAHVGGRPRRSCEPHSGRGVVARVGVQPARQRQDARGATARRSRRAVSVSRGACAPPNGTSSRQSPSTPRRRSSSARSRMPAGRGVRRRRPSGCASTTSSCPRRLPRAARRFRMVCTTCSGTRAG